MADYAGIYKLYLLDEKKASANTVESYMRDVKQFTSFCAVNNIDDLMNVTGMNIQKYLENLTAAGKSEATKTRIVASVRGFYGCMAAKGLCKGNPVGDIRIKKTEKKMPGILDAAEIMLLLSKPNGTDYKSLRDKAMLELLYATGIKVSELIELRMTDINLQLGILHLHSEKKERVIPVYPAAVKTMTEFLNNVRPAIVIEPEEDRLFTNMNGRALSRQGFWKIIKFYAEKAGIDKGITPHTLRHSFAAHLLENGAELKDIKEMLGHSDISSTQVYARFVKNKYTLAYTKYHPLAK